MTSNIDHIRITDVRNVAKRVVEDEQVTDFAVEVARESLSTMRDEAVEHGLTEADVVRAVLSPVFERKHKGCDCFTCMARRTDMQNESVDRLAAC